MSTTTTDDVITTLTLPTKVNTAEAERAVNVTATGYSTVVKICCQGEYSLATKLRVASVNETNINI